MFPKTWVILGLSHIYRPTLINSVFHWSLARAFSYFSFYLDHPIVTISVVNLKMTTCITGFNLLDVLYRNYSTNILSQVISQHRSGHVSLWDYDENGPETQWAVKTPHRPESKSLSCCAVVHCKVQNCTSVWGRAHTCLETEDMYELWVKTYWTILYISSTYSSSIIKPLLVF